MNNSNRERIHHNGVTYIQPESKILHRSPLAASEIGARVCYDSFDKAETGIKYYTFEDLFLPEIEQSDLAEHLSHVYHHESIMEHTNVTFHLRNVGRGVLQEVVRHRIAAYSVRSTRYTMSDLLITGLVHYRNGKDNVAYEEWLVQSDAFILDGFMLKVEARTVADKLFSYIDEVGILISTRLILSKDQIEAFDASSDLPVHKAISLITKEKNKRNVGDTFKFLISDMFSTELVVTMNMRALKNFFSLRRSGAAYFLIRALADDMFDQLPDGYKRIIVKPKKD